MARIIPFPSLNSTLPNGALCECGREYGDHSHVGLKCPIFLGNHVANHSGVRTFKLAAEQPFEVKA